MLYGAAEFSRDVDFAVLADNQNLKVLDKCLKSLRAELVAIPEFNRAYLDRGHVIHFRCKVPEAEGMRIDIISKMRGVDPFPELWRRRTTFQIDGDFSIDALNVWDLVRAKKTQRDKDWPMIRRLIEANYYSTRGEPSAEQLRFWLLELRTPEILIAVAEKHSSVAKSLSKIRPLLTDALEKKLPALTTAIAREEELQRQEDRAYWTPLKAELEQLRHQVVKKGSKLRRK